MVLVMIAAACGGGDEPDTTDNQPSGDDIKEGGIYRVGMVAFNFTNGFDPTGEYLGAAWSYYGNLSLRTLVTYKHRAGAEGNELVPDLATDMGEVSDDGLTYTFTLKDGIKFGPPLDREITSQDIEYAFRRIATESLVAQYANYYEGVIDGLEVGKDPGPGGIAGIETPDEKTIVFHLTKPHGDFLYRLAMPATAPMPEEVAGCFDKAGEYGRYVISSGPYMIEGSDELDASSCDTLKPISGFDPNRRLSFVRNPSYDEATDSPDARDNYVDGVEFIINTNLDDIFAKIEAGELEGSVDSPPPKVIRNYVTSDELKDRLHAESGDRTWYLTMNLAVPPFDDIHVRKAVNLVIDKEGLQRAWGGETAGDIATHIMPPEMTGGTPTAEEYDPYASDGHAGDVEAAKAEMAQSKYDSDGDGVCDDPVCKNLLMLNRNYTPWTEMEPIVVDNLGQLGLEVTPRELVDAYPPLQTVAKAVPLGLNPGWGKDYPDPFTFVGFLFDSRGIIPTGNYNYSLVGMTEEQANEFGIAYPDEPIPSVDADIDACIELSGDERTQCWIDLDKKLMEEIVPWVPYLWAKNIDITGPAVTAYDYDQDAGETAWSRVAVDESLQK